MKEFASWKSYKIFAKKIRYANRYFFDSESDNFIDTIIKTRGDRVKKCNAGNKLWRAQLGCESKHTLPKPYKVERMKPLYDQAKGGRANPPGIPHLYCATLTETALSEVRPWVGSEISLAELETTVDLNMIDCFTDTSHSGEPFSEEPSAKIKERCVWGDIGNAFSRPVSSEEQDTDYIPTQIISELFRRHGYGGIYYKSMLGGGLNVVLFKLNSARIVSCELYKPDVINFSFSKIEI